jgi:hypothetical protein
MRTKALLGLAVLAAGAVSCMAQGNVYSLNIVGYVNVGVQGGNKLTLIANPLKPSNGNYNVTNTLVMPDTADGANLFAWAGTSWNSVVPQWYAGSGWYPDLNVDLGSAFFVQSPVVTTVTFVGEVATGDISSTLNKGVNFVANKVPVAEGYPGGTVGNDGDNIYQWSGSAWSGQVYQYYAGYGWDDGTGNVGTNGPVLNPGQGVVYVNSGAAALNWTRTFNP